jgi:hypothetical protein
VSAHDTNVHIGRALTVLASTENLTLADVRQLVEMASTPLELPDGSIAPPINEESRVSVFTVGVRQGLLLEGRHEG